jgi:hypothetical protein
VVNDFADLVNYHVTLAVQGVLINFVFGHENFKVVCKLGSSHCLSLFKSHEFRRQMIFVLLLQLVTQLRLNLAIKRLISLYQAILTCEWRGNPFGCSALSHLTILEQDIFILSLFPG